MFGVRICWWQVYLSELSKGQCVLSPHSLSLTGVGSQHGPADSEAFYLEEWWRPDTPP